MHSFISSFKTPIQIVVIGLCLFLGYNAFLLLVGNRIPVGPLQSIDEANQANVDSYWRGGYLAPTVITGSSLSAVIPTDAFPGGAAMLAQIGGTALTGLDIILANGSHPKTVFVELNYLFRAPDEGIVSKTNDHLALLSRRWLPSLQVRFRPLNLMLAIAKGMQKTSGIESADALVDARTFASAVDAAKKGKASLLDQAILDQRFIDARHTIDRLIGEGVHVVLVEMPIDPSIRRTPQVRQIFDTAARLLPQSRYTWFVPPLGNYRTMDGEHMVHSVARRFAKQLAKVRSP